MWWPRVNGIPCNRRQQVALYHSPALPENALVHQTGIVKWKADPFPGSESTQILP